MTKGLDDFKMSVSEDITELYEADKELLKLIPQVFTPAAPIPARARSLTRRDPPDLRAAPPSTRR